MRSMGCERSADFRLLQGAARVEVLLADSNDDVVAVRFDHLHLRHVEHMEMAAEFGEQARLFLAGTACAAFELREQPRQQGLPFVGAGTQMARPDPRERLAETFLIERLQ